MDERDEREDFCEGDPLLERDGGPTDTVPLTFAEAVGSFDVDGEDVEVFERAAENDMDNDLIEVLVDDDEIVEVSDFTFDFDVRADAVTLVDVETDFVTPDEAEVEEDGLTDFDADDDPDVVFVSFAEPDVKVEREAEMDLSGDLLTEVLPVAVLLIEMVLDDVDDAVVVRLTLAVLVEVAVGFAVKEIAAERVQDLERVDEGDAAALRVLVFVFVDVRVPSAVNVAPAEGAIPSLATARGAAPLTSPFFTKKVLRKLDPPPKAALVVVLKNECQSFVRTDGVLELQLGPTQLETTALKSRKPINCFRMRGI